MILSPFGRGILYLAFSVMMAKCAYAINGYDILPKSQGYGRTSATIVFSLPSAV
jgi:hypothetical protein